MSTGQVWGVDRLGIFTPKQLDTTELNTGELVVPKPCNSPVPDNVLRLEVIAAILAVAKVISAFFSFIDLFFLAPNCIFRS